MKKVKLKCIYLSTNWCARLYPMCNSFLTFRNPICCIKAVLHTRIWNSELWLTFNNLDFVCLSFVLSFTLPSLEWSYSRVSWHVNITSILLHMKKELPNWRSNTYEALSHKILGSRMVCSLFPPTSKSKNQWTSYMSKIFFFLCYSFCCSMQFKSQNSKRYYFEPCYVPEKANVNFTGTDSPKKHWTSSEALFLFKDLYRLFLSFCNALA